MRGTVEKRSLSRKKEGSLGLREENTGITVTRELIDSLATLRMDATNLKAILSNEMFRLKQSCSKESRMIEHLFSGLIEGLIDQKEAIMARLNKQSNILVTEIGSSMHKSNLKVMDKIFEALSVGGRLTKPQVGTLTEIIRQTEVQVSNVPKKLTLSEIQEENIEDLVEDIATTLNDRLNFQVFEQDFGVVQTFNRKVQKIKSEFGSMVETGEVRTLSSSKMLPLDSPKQTHEPRKGSREGSTEKSWRKYTEENKENLMSLNKWPEIDLAKNNIDRISLECDEKLRLFRDCGINQGVRDSAADQNLSDLACCDEILPPLTEINRDCKNDNLRRSESSILIDDEDDSNKDSVEVDYI